MKLSNGDKLTFKKSFNVKGFITVKTLVYKGMAASGEEVSPLGGLGDMSPLFIHGCEKIESKDGKEIEVSAKYVEEIESVDDYAKIDTVLTQLAIEAVGKIKG